MTAQELRNWLSYAVGKSINFMNIQGQNRQGQLPVRGAAANGSLELYFPITIRRMPKASGFGWELQVVGSNMANRDGVYLPDYENQCTWVDATQNSNGIIISGRFSGCTFARCISRTGHSHFGHIYVNSQTAGNNPMNQARAFENACNSFENTASGFKTTGRVRAHASYGYVIGTFSVAWQLNWLTIDMSGCVVESSIIQPGQLLPLR